MLKSEASALPGHSQTARCLSWHNRGGSVQNWYRHILMWTLVSSLLLAGHSTQATAGEPLDKVHQTVDNVLTIVHNKALQPQERQTQIRQAVLQRFGFAEMAQRSMGQHWRTLTPAAAAGVRGAVHGSPGALLRYPYCEL